MNCYLKTTNLALLDLYHFLKPMLLLDLYHCSKPMLQFKLINMGVGVGIMGKVEAVVVVAIILGIEVIIISLKTRTIPPTTRS